MGGTSDEANTTTTSIVPKVWGNDEGRSRCTLGRPNFFGHRSDAARLRAGTHTVIPTRDAPHEYDFSKNR